MKKRITVALLSAILFSLILSYISYTPFAEREPNSGYESFGSFIRFYLLFSVPVYLFGAIPLSYLIDKHVEKELVKLPLYVLGGFFAGIITIMISFMAFGVELLMYGAVGAFAGFIFFVLMWLTNRIK